MKNRMVLYGAVAGVLLHAVPAAALCPGTTDACPTNASSNHRLIIEAIVGGADRDMTGADEIRLGMIGSDIVACIGPHGGTQDLWGVRDLWVDDTVDGLQATSHLCTNNGNDKVYVLTANYSCNGFFTVNAFDYNTFTLEVHGQAGNDNLTGGDGVEMLCGGSGVDTLIGGASNDSLDGWTGDDVLDGGSGDDDHVYGWDDNDNVCDATGSGDDLFGEHNPDCLWDQNNTWGTYDCGSTGTDSDLAYNGNTSCSRGAGSMTDCETVCYSFQCDCS